MEKRLTKLQKSLQVAPQVKLAVEKNLFLNKEILRSFTPKKNSESVSQSGKVQELEEEVRVLKSEKMDMISEMDQLKNDYEDLKETNKILSRLVEM